MLGVWGVAVCFDLLVGSFLIDWFGFELGLVIVCVLAWGLFCCFVIYLRLLVAWL